MGEEEEEEESFGWLLLPAAAGGKRLEVPLFMEDRRRQCDDGAGIWKEEAFLRR